MQDNELKAKSYIRYGKRKDPKTGQWFDAETEIFYYSIGQVRQLFNSLVNQQKYETTFERFEGNPFALLKGKLTYRFNPEDNSENEIAISLLINLDDITAQETGKNGQLIDKTSENFNKKNTSLEKRLKVMALGLPDPEEEEEEKNDYVNFDQQQQQKASNSNAYPEAGFSTMAKAGKQPTNNLQPVQATQGEGWSGKKANFGKVEETGEVIDQKKINFIMAMVGGYSDDHRHRIFHEMHVPQSVKVWTETDYKRFIKPVREVLGQPAGLIDFKDEKGGINSNLLGYFNRHVEVSLSFNDFAKDDVPEEGYNSSKAAADNGF